MIALHNEESLTNVCDYHITSHHTTPHHTTQHNTTSHNTAIPISQTTTTTHLTPFKLYNTPYFQPHQQTTSDMTHPTSNRVFLKGLQPSYA
jgi:hypothetical protein